jgi:hypothetical protein
MEEKCQAETNYTSVTELNRNTLVKSLQAGQASFRFASVRFLATNKLHALARKSPTTKSRIFLFVSSSRTGDDDDEEYLFRRPQMAVAYSLLVRGRK